MTFYVVVFGWLLFFGLTRTNGSLHDLLLTSLAVLFQMLLIAASCMVHEFGHVIGAKMVGRKVEGIPLHGLCAFCILRDGVEDLEIRNALFFAAGPAVNLAFGGICVLLDYSALADMNFALGLANLVWIYPLDGGRIADVILRHMMRDPAKATMLLRWLSRSAYALLFLVFEGAVGIGVAVLLIFVSEWLLWDELEEVRTTDAMNKFPVFPGTGLAVCRAAVAVSQAVEE